MKYSDRNIFNARNKFKLFSFESKKRSSAKIFSRIANLNNERIKKFDLKDWVKFVVGLICVIGLTISTYFAIIQFVNYRTKVSYRLEDPLILDLPGLTFCLPIFITTQTLEELYPEYKFIVNQIQIAIKEEKIQLSKYNDLYSLLKDIGIENKTLDKLSIIGSLRPDKLQAFFESKALKNWTAIQAFEFSAKPFFKSCKIEAEYVLEEMDHEKEECDWFGEPLESIIDDRKCLTYFSQLNIGNKSRDLYRIYMRKPFRIVISIVEKPNVWLALQRPYMYLQYIRMYVHPANLIPAKNEIDFILLESEHHYDIRYTKIDSRLMKKPYCTDCESYKLGNYSVLQSRSDCLDKCLLTNIYQSKDDYHKNKSRCIDVNFGTRKDLLRDNDKLCNMRFDIYSNSDKKYFNERVYDVKMKCLSQCKRDCNDILYDVNVMSAERRFGEIHLWIGHRAGPFTVIEHSPEISWFDLFSNLSAFSSLWIGFSIFNMYVWVTHGLKFIYHYYLKFRSGIYDGNKLNYNQNIIQINRINRNTFPYK